MPECCIYTAWLPAPIDGACCCEKKKAAGLVMTTMSVKARRESHHLPLLLCMLGMQFINQLKLI